MAKVGRRSVSRFHRDVLASLDEDLGGTKAADEIEETMLEADEDLEDVLGDGVEASESVPGVEDSIVDTGEGGQPTVQTVVDQGDKVESELPADSEVFPTSEPKVAKRMIVQRLDRVANVLERNGEKKLAFRIDQISDYLERK